MEKLDANIQDIINTIKEDAENSEIADILDASVDVVLAVSKLIGLYKDYYSKGARKIRFNGESHTLDEWSRIVGIPKQTLRKRVKEHHWRIEDALTTPVLDHENFQNFNKKVTVMQYNPKQQLMRTFESMSEAARQCGIQTQTIKSALEGMSPLEQVARWGCYFTTPKTMSEQEIKDLMGA